MKRYYSDDESNENYFDPDETEGDDEPQLPEGLVEEIAAAIGKEDVINAMQFDLAQLGLNQSLLRIAIQVASSHVQWKGKGTDAKLTEIEEIYKRLQKLTNGEAEGEEGEKEEGSGEEDANL